MADKVHPVIEAMARAMFDSLIQPHDQKSRLYQRVKPEYIEAAKAAAKVLLSAEPTEGLLTEAAKVDASSAVMDHGFGPAYDAEMKNRAKWQAMTAALRSEMGIE